MRGMKQNRKNAVRKWMQVCIFLLALLVGSPSLYTYAIEGMAGSTEVTARVVEDSTEASGDEKVNPPNIPGDADGVPRLLTGIRTGDAGGAAGYLLLFILAGSIAAGVYADWKKVR